MVPLRYTRSLWRRTICVSVIRPSSISGSDGVFCELPCRIHVAGLTRRAQFATVGAAIYYGGVAVTSAKQNEYFQKQRVLLGEFSLIAAKDPLTSRRTTDKHSHPGSGQQPVVVALELLEQGESGRLGLPRSRAAIAEPTARFQRGNRRVLRSTIGRERKILPITTGRTYEGARIRRKTSSCRARA